MAVAGVPAVLLSAAARLLVVADDRHRHRLGCGHRRHQRAVGRLSTGAAAARQHQRQPLQQHQRQPPDRRQQPDANWNHNPDRRGNTPYRGGDATRQNLARTGTSPATASSTAARTRAATPAASAPTRRCRTAASTPAADPRASARRAWIASGDAERRRAPIAARRRTGRRTSTASAAQNGRRAPIAMPRRQRAQSASRDNALQGREQPAGAAAGRSRCGEPAGRGSARRWRRQPAAAQRGERWRRAAVGGGGGGGARPAAAVAVAAAAVAAAAVAAVAAAADGVVEMERTNMTNIKHILQDRRRGRQRWPWRRSAFAQNAYPTPEAAADALVDGIARHDGDAIKAVVGPDYQKYIPAEQASIRRTSPTSSRRGRAAHTIVPAGDDKAFLGVGKNGWTLPIPIVKTAAGWRFDTKARSRGNAHPPHRPQRARGDPGGARLHRRAGGVSRARLERRRRARNTRSTACRRRASTTGCTGRRCPASRRARSARSSPTRRRASRTTGICTGSSPRRARTRRAARAATSRTAG